MATRSWRQTAPARPGSGALAGLLALALATPARAHDTWWALQPASERGEVMLALGTGNRYPVQDSAMALQQVLQSGCVASSGDGAGRAWPLRWMADRPDALVLRTTRPVPGTVALSCWAQLSPVAVRIDKPETVATYLQEIHASPAVRERWAALQARGVPWQETFVKHARTELLPTLPGNGPQDRLPGGDTPTPAIAGLGMDVRLASPRPLRAGDTLRAQLLRDGQPLAGLAVELRSNLSPLGLWRTTDAQGRIEIPLPLAAQWLLRAVDLRPSAQRADEWDSRFVTLAFSVLPRPAP